MRRARLVLLALLSGCASEPAAPPPAPAEPPPIETSSMAPATAQPEPVAPPPDEKPAPAQPLPAPLAQAQIERTFAGYRRDFEKLYIHHRQRQQKLGGTVLVSFQVNPDGRVQNVSVPESSVADAAFEQALLKQVEQMTFPAATGPTPVERFPLQFSAPTQK